MALILRKFIYSIANRFLVPRLCPGVYLKNERQKEPKEHVREMFFLKARVSCWRNACLYAVARLHLEPTLLCPLGLVTNFSFNSLLFSLTSSLCWIHVTFTHNAPSRVLQRSSLILPSYISYLPVYAYHLSYR